MITHNSRFSAMLTKLGERKQAAAIAANLPWVWTHMGVGDANGVDPLPDPEQLALISERYRAALNQVVITVTRHQVVCAELIIPATAGGWWIRETGLYDSDGDLVAVANCPASYKPVISQGAGKTQVVRMNLAVAGDAKVTLLIDDTPVMATHEHVASAIERASDALRDLIAGPEGVTPGSFRQVDVDERGLVVSGSNPTTLRGYEIEDAYTKSEANRAFVSVGKGPGQGQNWLSLGWDGKSVLASVDQTDMGNLWYAGNFNPDSKADKIDTYTRAQTDERLDERLLRDSIKAAGFAGNDPGAPYFRRVSDDQVVYLQNRLGFTPVQQGTGNGQSSSVVKIGWGSSVGTLRAQVDNTDLGALWTEHAFCRPDANNFIGIAQHAASITLPAGGTWCYSLMQFFSSGAATVGRSGLAAGGSVIHFGEGHTIYGFAWRFS